MKFNRGQGVYGKPWGATPSRHGTPSNLETEKCRKNLSPVDGQRAGNKTKIVGKYLIFL